MKQVKLNGCACTVEISVELTSENMYIKWLQFKKQIT